MAEGTAGTKPGNGFICREGNEPYGRGYESVGLTTRRCRHVNVKASTHNFQFKGKSGVSHDVDLTDPRLAKICKNSPELPRYTLFHERNASAEKQSMESFDVNTDLREIPGPDVTATDSPPVNSLTDSHGVLSGSY